MIIMLFELVLVILAIVARIFIPSRTILYECMNGQALSVAGDALDANTEVGLVVEEVKVWNNCTDMILNVPYNFQWPLLSSKQLAINQCVEICNSSYKVQSVHCYSDYQD